MNEDNDGNWGHVDHVFLSPGVSVFVFNMKNLGVTELLDVTCLFAVTLVIVTVFIGSYPTMLVDHLDLLFSLFVV